MSSPLESIISGNKLAQQNASTGNNELGKDDFLKLLTIQLRNQDPLNPMDNAAMTAQMAQFSSLEQMSNLNDNFTKSNLMSSFVDATRLLGKEVELFDYASSPENPSTITTKVKSVTYSDNGPVLELENGQAASVIDILKVNEPAS